LESSRDEIVLGAKRVAMVTHNSRVSMLSQNFLHNFVAVAKEAWKNQQSWVFIISQ
jgi:hypothetical protein